MAGTGRAGIDAASHGAGDWVGAACTAGTAGHTDRGNAVMVTAIGTVVATAIGMATVAAIASESIPARHAAAVLLTAGLAAARRRARVSRATGACEVRATC